MKISKVARLYRRYRLLLVQARDEVPLAKGRALSREERLGKFPAARPITARVFAAKLARPILQLGADGHLQHLLSCFLAGLEGLGYPGAIFADHWEP